MNHVMHTPTITPKADKAWGFVVRNAQEGGVVQGS